jgi:arginine/ornithine transport system substrate-binding protein
MPIRSLTQICAAAVVAGVAASLAPAPASADTKEWETVRVGVDAAYEPFIWQKPDGSLVGFEMELARAWCDVMDVTCTFQAHPFDSIIPALNAGKFDAIIASMYVKEERKEKVDFSDVYYFVPGRYVAPKSMDIEISKEGLEGKVIGVQSGTLEELHVQKQFGDVATIRTYEGQGEVFLDAASGRIDVTLASQVVLQRSFLDTPQGSGWAFVGPVVDDPEVYGEGAAVAVRKEDDRLLAMFNQAIDEVLANGTYRKIQDKWFDFNIYGKPYGDQKAAAEAE